MTQTDSDMHPDVHAGGDAWFEEPDDTCPEVVSILVGDLRYELRCEEDAGHEGPHSGTVMWSDS